MLASKQEPETGSVTLEQSELESWTNARIRERLASLQTTVDSLHHKLATTKKRLDTDIAKLRDAQLRNKNLPPRVLSVMEGNRKMYLRRVQDFAGRTEPQKTVTLDSLADWQHFFSTFREELDTFAKATQKSYMVLQEFFSHESRSIALGIKSMEKDILDAKKIFEKSGCFRYNIVLRELKSLKALKAEHQQLRTSHRRTESSLAEQENVLRRASKALEDYIKSEGCRELAVLRQQLMDCREKLRKREAELLHFLLTIEKPLLKYERITIDTKHAALISGYLREPLDAFRKDTSLAIATIAANIRDALEKGQITIKDKLRDKAKHALERFTPKHLSSQRRQLEELQLKMHQAQEKVEQHPAAAIQRDLRRKREQAAEKQATLREQLDREQRALEKSSPSQKSRELGGVIGKMFKAELRIK